MNQRVHVLIADHEARTRRGLRALLSVWPQIEVMGAATNAVEAVQLLEKYRPEVVLVNIPLLVVAGPDLPAQDGRGDRPGRESERLDGLEAIRRIKSRQPQVGVVALALYATQRTDVLAAGADAFLLKGCPAQEMLEALTNHVQPSRQAGAD